MRKLLFLSFVFLLSLNVVANEEDDAHLYVKVSELEVQLREMRGHIQQLEYDNKQLIAKLSNLVDDINYKFAQFASRSKEAYKKQKDLSDYIDMFSEGKVSDAMNGLHEYIKYAEEEMKGEAYYWLGRCYFAESNHKEAGVYFLKSYKYYPANRQAASSLIYLSISLEKLDKVNRACAMLDRANTEYPAMSQKDRELYEQELAILRCGAIKIRP